MFNTSATAGNLTNFNAKITGTRVFGAGGDSELGFWTTETSVSTASQQRMVITKEGNVGIATTTPSAKLDVQGTLIATGISQLGSGGNNVYLTSSSAGNVGIGTSSPTEKLDVSGNIKFGDSHFLGNDSFDNLYLLASSGENAIIDSPIVTGKHLIFLLDYSFQYLHNLR